MNTVMLLTSDTLGRGDDELGARLMTKFLAQLSTVREKPDVMAFYNGGVRLLAPSSPALDAVKALEADGVEIIACGTCLDHFGLRQSIAVGRISDMREIVMTLVTAAKVVTV